MLNQVALMGRLTRDPELKYTSTNKPVTSFKLAVDRDYKGDQRGGLHRMRCMGPGPPRW